MGSKISLLVWMTPLVCECWFFKIFPNYWLKLKKILKEIKWFCSKFGPKLVRLVYKWVVFSWQNWYLYGSTFKFRSGKSLPKPNLNTVRGGWWWYGMRWWVCRCVNEVCMEVTGCGWGFWGWGWVFVCVCVCGWVGGWVNEFWTSGIVYMLLLTIIQFGQKVDWVSYGKKKPLSITKSLHCSSFCQQFFPTNFWLMDTYIYQKHTKC